MIKSVTVLSSKPLLLCLYLSSVICFIAGVSLPVFTTTKFFFFHDEISILGSIGLLFDEEKIFLALVILIFSILFPIAKISIQGYALFFSSSGNARKLLHIIKNAGKWSMMDVFVIALLIVSFKSNSLLLNIEVQSGTVFFALAVIINGVANHYLLAYLDRICPLNRDLTN